MLRVEILDGDAVRPHLAAARGYSREDRAINIRRIGWVAELLARNGVLVLVSAIAPFRDVRDEVRAAHAAQRHPLPGGARQHAGRGGGASATSRASTRGSASGEISGLTGVDDPYEEPLAPDLVIAAHEHPVEESVALLLDFLTAHGGRRNHRHARERTTA